VVTAFVDVGPWSLGGDEGMPLGEPTDDGNIRSSRFIASA
jgi:hypothetical protein